MLRIAIQKSGRLSEQSLALLAESNIEFGGHGRALLAQSKNFPLEILYLRDDDIPQCVYDGVADIGIVGEDVLQEKNYALNIVERLGMGKCRMSLAIPKSVVYNDLKWFNGKKIATSYPRVLGNFLQSNNIAAEIHEISGSVEISTTIGLADAIFDIVSSGSTLVSNGLKEVETVLHSEAVMVSQKEGLTEDKQLIINDLLFRLRAVQKGRQYKYILLNVPTKNVDKIIDVIPGSKSPTVVPLAQEGWSSVHSVLPENDFWKIIDQLKKLDAQGILVMPIEKMIL
ncbi:ATP phosphoribosyltransferase [Bacteroidia bacterium]|nr:ATP phosphoribosyltransferase [Bacteroidia bacterium]